MVKIVVEESVSGQNCCLHFLVHHQHHSEIRNSPMSNKYKYFGCSRYTSMSIVMICKISAHIKMKGYIRNYDDERSSFLLRTSLRLRCIFIVLTKNTYSNSTISQRYLLVAGYRMLCHSIIAYAILVHGDKTSHLA